MPREALISKRCGGIADLISAMFLDEIKVNPRRAWPMGTNNLRGINSFSSWVILEVQRKILWAQRGNIWDGWAIHGSGMGNLTCYTRNDVCGSICLANRCKYLIRWFRKCDSMSIRKNLVGETLDNQDGYGMSPGTIVISSIHDLPWLFHAEMPSTNKGSGVLCQTSLDILRIVG